MLQVSNPLVANTAFDAFYEVERRLLAARSTDYPTNVALYRYQLPMAAVRHVQDDESRNLWAKRHDLQGLLERAWLGGVEHGKSMRVTDPIQDYEFDTDDVGTEDDGSIVIMTGDVHVTFGIRMSPETATKLGKQLVDCAKRMATQKRGDGT